MPTSARSHGLRVAPIALMMMLAACSQEKAPKKGPVEVGVVTLTARNVTVDSELPGRKCLASSRSACLQKAHW